MDETEATPGTTLVVGVEDLGEEQFAPHLGQFPEIQVTDAVGDHLLRRDFETQELTPGLAESWEVSDDGLTWSFRLREGIPFHDDWGVVTAEDVEFTWAQFLGEDATATRTPIYRDAVGGDMSNFEIVSDTEFRIHTPEVTALLPQELATGQITMPIQSKAYWEEVGDEQAIAHPIGTGPFKFVSHTRGLEVTLEAVDNHWRQTPSVETVILRIVPDEAARLAQVQSGDLDLAALSLAQKPVAESAGVQIFSTQFVGTMTIHLGGRWEGLDEHDPGAPWIQDDNPEQAQAIRRALALAIDREAILERLLHNEGELLAVPLRGYNPGSALPWNDPSWEPLPYDPDAARELLAEGGYPDGFSVDFPMFLQPHAGRPPALDIAEAVAGMWEEIGIDIERRQMEWTPGFREASIERTTAGQAYLLASPAYPEPAPGLQAAYLSTGRVTHVSFPELDAAILALISEPDYDERMRMTRDVGEMLREDMTSIPMFTLNSLYAASSEIESWERLAGLAIAHNLEYVTLAED